MDYFDIAVIGAGAAGMMCASVAGQLGRRVVLLDHAERIGEKIRISGGGRCNFTNRDAGPANYLSANPHFCRSALARYTPQDFLRLLSRHRVAWHEKHRGQLFCDESSQDIIDLLLHECAAGGVSVRNPVRIVDIARRDVGSASSGDPEQGGQVRFVVRTDRGDIGAAALIVATGGLSIPKIGASGFAFDLAAQFGLPVITPEPALVPLTFTAPTWEPFSTLSGLSIPVGIGVTAGVTTGRTAGVASPSSGAEKKARKRGLPVRFAEDLLLTHRGLSGPAVLQISSYWHPPAALRIDLLPGMDAALALLEMKAGARRQLSSVLNEWLPQRLVGVWLAGGGLAPDVRLADLSDKVLRELGQRLNDWQVQPAGTEGWRKAEVTRGGVDTAALSSASMEAKAVEGLYFIGEAVDVTGWLGGYNFQWAWASGVAAGQAAAEATAATV